MSDHIKPEGPSKFQEWLDARLCNAGEVDIKEIAREAWNQGVQEAAEIARINRIKEREGTLEYAHDFTIGHILQLKEPKHLKHTKHISKHPIIFQKHV